MSILLHADDYGITIDQARSILGLFEHFENARIQGSISAFANSPVFDEVAALARPHVEKGTLLAGLHANLVEGSPCAPATDIPLLVGPRDTFCNDFTGLLQLSQGPQRDELRRQIQKELTAQLERFLKTFPFLQNCLRADSHQHTHAIPLVFDALNAAIREAGCTLEHLRTPVEPLSPHFATAGAWRNLTPINLAKNMLLAMLWKRNQDKVPQDCSTSLFCGVILSGRMDRVDADLIRAFETLANKRATQEAMAGATNVADTTNGINRLSLKNPAESTVEILFHPVSVPQDQCLDPENRAFATACASPSRDLEAQAMVQQGSKLAQND